MTGEKFKKGQVRPGLENDHPMLLGVQNQKVEPKIQTKRTNAGKRHSIEDSDKFTVELPEKS